MKTLSRRRARPPPVMPDLRENSESQEDEDEDAPSDPGQANGERVFPSLPDSLLKKMVDGRPRSVSRDKPTDQEIENRFTTLSLAFKTDKFTLDTRLELLKRHRDTAEENIETELKELRTAVNKLNHFHPDPETRELFVNLQRHIDVIRQSVDRLSGKSELYGAVQQEQRLSGAVEVMVTHVENLKRLREKERAELEETRRLLLETRLLSTDKRDRASLSHSALVDCVGPSKPTGISRRRASVAGYHRPLLSDAKLAANNWILMPGSDPPEMKRSLAGRASVVEAMEIRESPESPSETPAPCSPPEVSSSSSPPADPPVAASPS